MPELEGVGVVDAWGGGMSQWCSTAAAQGVDVCASLILIVTVHALPCAEEASYLDVGDAAITLMLGTLPLP